MLNFIGIVVFGTLKSISARVLLPETFSIIKMFLKALCIGPSIEFIDRTDGDRETIRYIKN